MRSRFAGICSPRPDWLTVLAIVVGSSLAASDHLAAQEHLPSPAEADEGLPAGSGSFLFMESPGARDNPVRVWYHIPVNMNSDARVLIAMHGSGGTARGGRGNRDAWAPLADRHGFVVFAPEFSWAEYPSHSHYHWGNMFTEAGDAVDDSLWAFTTVAQIFDEIRRRFGITTPTYTIYGHSAGAQFVHRMMIFKPDSQVDAYIAANPGNYTMPSLDWEYPYGLDKGTPEVNAVTEELLVEALQRPLLLLVGAADTATALSANNMRPEAMAQGPNRLERGKLFFELAGEEAKRRQVPLRWEFRVVPDVRHDNRGMAEAAVRALAW